MARFQLEETEQEPLLVRNDARVVCLVEYERHKSGGVKPIRGYDVTSAYEHRRGRDAVLGIPLLDEYVEPRTAGEVAYLTHASGQGWSTPWTELEEEQRDAWNQIGSSVVKYLQGDDVPYMY